MTDYTNFDEVKTALRRQYGGMIGGPPRDLTFAVMQMLEKAELSAVTREDLTWWIHARNAFDYDECSHGTYSGGPSNGEPYAMCERQADALLAQFTVLHPAPVRREELNPEIRHLLVESAVDAIEPNVTNRTHAYNIWNNLNTDKRFVEAMQAFHPRTVLHPAPVAVSETSP